MTKYPRIVLCLLIPLMLVLVAALALPARSSASNPSQAATFSSSLINVNSNLCLNVPNGSTTIGVQLNQWACQNNNPQLFDFNPVTGAANTFTLVNRSSALCVTVNGASTADGATIVQRPCTSGTHQQFRLTATSAFGGNKDFNVIAVHSGKCVEIGGASTVQGARAVQRTCASPVRSHQTWRINGYPQTGSGIILTPLRSDATSEWFTFTVSGDTTTGIVGKPVGSGPFAVVVINHGKGGVVKNFVADQIGPEFVSAGYMVIGAQYDYGGQTTPFLQTEVENHRRFDVVMDSLEQLSYADMERIAVFGHSMGGYLTVGMLHYDAGAQIDVAATTSGSLVYGTTEAEKDAFVMPIVAPLLLMHGTGDPSHTGSVSLDSRLTRLGKISDLILYEGVGHDLPGLMKDEVTDEALAWFETFLD